MEKLNVKKRIDALNLIKLSMPAESRIDELFAKINLKKNGTDPKEILDAAIWGVHLLSEYQKNYTTNRRVAESIIRATSERIEFLNRVASSEIAQLQATYYIVLSKIETMHGNYWNAMNFRNYSFELNKKNIPGGIANAYFAHGHSHLRNGFGSAAINNFILATETAEGYQLESACLLLAKTYRLCAQYELATDALDRGAAAKNPNAAIVLESLWERLCIEAQKSDNFHPLVEAVSKRGLHRAPSYILETKLWSHCAANSKEFLARPKVSSFARDKELNIGRAGTLYKNVVALEEADEDLRPLSNRMEKMNSALERTPELKLVEHSQLFLLASSHWFQKQKIYSSALNCLLKYEQISLSLTDGQNCDHLNLSSALRKKSWYTGNQTTLVKKSA